MLGTDFSSWFHESHLCVLTLGHLACFSKWRSILTCFVPCDRLAACVGVEEGRSRLLGCSLGSRGRSRELGCSLGGRGPSVVKGDLEDWDQLLPHLSFSATPLQPCLLIERLVCTPLPVERRAQTGRGWAEALPRCQDKWWALVLTANLCFLGAVSGLPLPPLGRYFLKSPRVLNLVRAPHSPSSKENWGHMHTQRCPSALFWPHRSPIVEDDKQHWACNAVFQQRWQLKQSEHSSLNLQTGRATWVDPPSLTPRCCVTLWS